MKAEQQGQGFPHSVHDLGVDRGWTDELPDVFFTHVRVYCTKCGKTWQYDLHDSTALTDRDRLVQALEKIYDGETMAESRYRVKWGELPVSPEYMARAALDAIQKKV